MGPINSDSDADTESESANRHKFSVWAWNMWNPCDGAAIILFVIGLAFRFRETTMDIGRVIYCVDSIYWYLRILNILGVNKYLGKFLCSRTKYSKIESLFLNLLRRPKIIQLFLRFILAESV